MEFNYLAVNITSSETLVKEIKTLTQKAASVPGCLNDLVWRNETKLKIYKTTVRPITTYALETKAET